MKRRARRSIAAGFLVLTLFEPVSYTQSTDRLAALRKAVTGRSPERPLNARVVTIFELGPDVRVIDAAGAVLPASDGRRRVSLALATAAGDVFVADSRKSQDSSKLIVYHAGADLVLRSVASGTDYDDLQIVSAAEHAASFGELMQIFERFAPSQ